MASNDAALLTAVTSRDGDTVIFTCSGCAETNAMPQLGAALEGVHADAIEAAARSVVADVRELQFASASCLKAFVSWLQRVQELDDVQRYKVVFRCDPRYSWQRRSLGALAAFAAGVVEIEAVSP